MVFNQYGRRLDDGLREVNINKKLLDMVDIL